MKYNLVQAIQMIEEQYNRTIVMIEYEDGSGKSFNVRFIGDVKAVNLVIH